MNYSDLVEKAFDILQSNYKPSLRGKGVIEKDARERWATDYRCQAILNLDEFTQIVIRSVLYFNSSRVLGSYVPDLKMFDENIFPIPCNLWRWYEQNDLSKVIPVNEKLMENQLPKTEKRKGAVCHEIRKRKNSECHILKWFWNN